MFRLEDVLSDEQFGEVWYRSGSGNLSSSNPAVARFGRACIALAVSKAPKVAGYVSAGVTERCNSSTAFEPSPRGFAMGARHALLLLGPKFEPKPVRSADRRISDAIEKHIREFHKGEPCNSKEWSACEMVKDLRGEE